ncbi:hypothetical protein ARMGADRAFT_632923 [Armillaria gallica]|uniref:Uncharacterized protein n=1 Tax=Armillaria gallica TaxID=47427 RepID=A0A2H3E0T6_ARMGA|nr:hypothetical protein ARMGADRAFT_632923 [Armillaria gallica]
MACSIKPVEGLYTRYASHLRKSFPGLCSRRQVYLSGEVGTNSCDSGYDARLCYSSWVEVRTVPEGRTYLPSSHWGPHGLAGYLPISRTSKRSPTWCHNPGKGESKRRIGLGGCVKPGAHDRHRIPRHPNFKRPQPRRSRTVLRADHHHYTATYRYRVGSGLMQDLRWILSAE